MVGCRPGAKNTLLKNSVWFADTRGASIVADLEVTDVRPIGVVVAAGALGTNRLLIKCKETGSLPRLSDRLGELVRTNSESILAVTLPDDARAPWNDVAISASIHPRP